MFAIMEVAVLMVAIYPEPGGIALWLIDPGLSVAMLTTGFVFVFMLNQIVIYVAYQVSGAISSKQRFGMFNSCCC